METSLSAILPPFSVYDTEGTLEGTFERENTREYCHYEQRK